MKLTNSLGIYFIWLLFVGCASHVVNQNQSTAEKFGWHLSMKSYTFRLFSGVEALEKTHDLGISYIEMSSNQKIGGDIGEDKFNYKLSPEKRRKIIEFAKSKGVKIVSTSMGTPKTDEWNDIFSFAKDMGLEFITAEPAVKDWYLVESLAVKYRIKVACHNHPSENSYWKPEVLLENIQNRSEFLGACCDIGHYRRMNLDPIECLRKMDGRIIALDFKDVSPTNSDTTLKDVVLGKGILDIRGMMKELRRQNFEGYFNIEYESNWDDNILDLRKSIEYFNRIAEQVLKEDDNIEK